MDAEGKLVAHAHDDRVGLIPVLSAQMSERFAMLFGGLDHEQPIFGVPDARGFSAANGIQGERDGLGIERLTVVDAIGVCTEPCR